MFSQLGAPEILIILVIITLLFGAKKLPELARGAGQGLRIFKSEVKGELKQFLLVPYFGACIHTPPPPANQIVHVRLSRPLRGVGTMDAVWVTGRLGRERSASALGASGYQLDATTVTKYAADEGSEDRDDAGQQGDRRSRH